MKFQVCRVRKSGYVQWWVSNMWLCVLITISCAIDFEVREWQMQAMMELSNFERDLGLLLNLWNHLISSGSLEVFVVKIGKQLNKNLHQSLHITSSYLSRGEFLLSGNSANKIFTYSYSSSSLDKFFQLHGGLWACLHKKVGSTGG